MVVGKSCRNFKRLSHMREMEAGEFTFACALLDFSILMQDFFSPLPPRECCHPLWAGSSHISSLRHLLTDVPTGQTNADSPWLRLFSQVIFDWVKLAIKANYHKYRRSPYKVWALRRNTHRPSVCGTQVDEESCFPSLPGCGVLLISTPPLPLFLPMLCFSLPVSPSHLSAHFWHWGHM